MSKANDLRKRSPRLRDYHFATLDERRRISVSSLASGIVTVSPGLEDQRNLNSPLSQLPTNTIAYTALCYSRRNFKFVTMREVQTLDTKVLQRVNRAGRNHYGTHSTTHRKPRSGAPVRGISWSAGNLPDRHEAPPGSGTVPTQAHWWTRENWSFSLTFWRIACHTGHWTTGTCRVLASAPLTASLTSHFRCLPRRVSSCRERDVPSSVPVMVTRVPFGGSSA